MTISFFDDFLIYSNTTPTPLTAYNLPRNIWFSVHNRMVPFRLRFANHKTQREMVLSEMFSRPEEEIDQENTIVYSDSAYVKYIV